MNNILWLIRREIWENRSLWIAPLVVAGVILVAAAFGSIHVGDGGSFWIGSGPSDAGLNAVDRDLHKTQERYAKAMGLFAVVHFVVLSIVVFFYLLDALLAERKDRSILFWKSLPISDLEVVGSKLLTALLVAPVYVLFVSAATQILFAPIWSLRSDTPLGSAFMAWDGTIWLQVQAAFWMLAPAVLVWYLPIACYALLVSVWARKNAFLWAMLPPAGILLIEGLLMQSHHFGEWLLRRFIGVFQIIADAPHRHVPAGDDLAELIRRIGNVFTQGETWLGVFVAAALFVVVVRFRRYRDDS